MSPYLSSQFLLSDTLSITYSLTSDLSQLTQLRLSSKSTTRPSSDISTLVFWKNFILRTWKNGLLPEDWDRLDTRSLTAFQKKVYPITGTLPFGQTISYGTLSERCGSPKGARAIGLAMSRNPFALIVPCHRVVAANGALTGYAYGLELKQELLDLEALLRNA